jgi:primosomal protein N' (replication factor Y) (superfamily II helicase)
MQHGGLITQSALEGIAPPPEIAQIVVELPLETPLDYYIPPALRMCCRIGQRVLVPLGKRQVLGYIVGLASTSTVAELKELVEILDETPLLTPAILQLTHWIAEYYLCSWGQVLKAAVPEGFRVQTEAVYTLTAQVQDNPASWPQGKAGEVLQCLAHHGTQRQHELERLLEVQDLGPWLRRLEQQGLVLRQQQRLAPKTQPRLVTMVRLRLSCAEAEALRQQLQQRSPNQAAVLALLREQPVWELAALRQRCPGAPAAVKRLALHAAVDVTQVEKMRAVVPSAPMAASPLPTLNQAQQHALWQIEARLASAESAPVLLYGVTGSGKTEVYMRAIAAALRQGKTALVLVPEIALTDQLVERFVARFTSQIAVLHSGLSAGERFDEWRRLAGGEARIAIGARSAVFAPLDNLGLIVVDEEHESSYKQEETPRYHARDVAIVRAQQCHAVVVLGSATPALETFHNARSGKYLALSLPQRVEDKPLPSITVIDQRAHAMPNERVISTPLYQAIAACMQRQEQCLILINRRGFASYLQCRDCGVVPQCAHCSVSLTYHRRDRTLKCHYCDASQPAPSVCAACSSPTLYPFGLGTQQVEEVLRALFPTARLARMDRDTTRAKAAHQRILRTLGSGDIDILVGTQMIAKGHDYPNITLVGVVSADATLAIPDFRAPERLFQLLTQVAGRAGRGQVHGHVFLQTYRPEHYSIAFAQHHDFTGFFQDEIQRRQAMLYPPYTRLARLIIDSPDAVRAEEASRWLGTVLQRRIPYPQHATLLGPAEAPIAKIKDRHRWHMLLKATSSRALHQWLKDTLAETHQERDQLRAARLSVDIDPVTFL